MKMKSVYIDAKSDGYSPEQCGETLTIRELIEILEEFDGDLPVYIRNDNGYTYGSINVYDIE